MPLTTPTTSDFLISFQNQLAKANIGPIAATFAATLNPIGQASVTVTTVLEGGGNSAQTLTFSGSPGGSAMLSFNGLQRRCAADVHSGREPHGPAGASFARVNSRRPESG